MNAVKRLLLTSCLSPFRISFSETFLKVLSFWDGMEFGHNSGALCTNCIRSGIGILLQSPPSVICERKKKIYNWTLKYRLHLDVSLRQSAGPKPKGHWSYAVTAPFAPRPQSRENHGLGGVLVFRIRPVRASLRRAPACLPPPHR
jgi:hypothetical protein